MLSTLLDHPTSIGGRLLCKVHFADEIDLMVGSNSKLPKPTNSESSASAYGMVINTDKSNVKVNTIRHDKAEIFMEGVHLE